MNLDALIHRKFSLIMRQYDAKDTIDLQSSAIVVTAPRLDHEVRVLDLGDSHRAGLAALGSVTRLSGESILVIGSERQRAHPASTQEKRHH